MIDGELYQEKDEKYYLKLEINQLQQKNKQYKSKLEKSIALNEELIEDYAKHNNNVIKNYNNIKKYRDRINKLKD